MVARLNHGVALLNLQKVDEAKALLEDAVKQDPKDPHAWYNLGLFYKNTSDTDAAVDAFSRVIEIDPNDADTWYFLGTVYAQPKQYPQAIDAFEHALKLNPLHASGEFGISRAYQQSGDTAEVTRTSEEISVHHAEQAGLADQPGLRRAGKVFARGGVAGLLEKVPAAIPVKFVDVTAEAGIKGQGTGNAPKLLSDFLGQELASSIMTTTGASIYSSPTAAPAAGWRSITTWAAGSSRMLRRRQASIRRCTGSAARRETTTTMDQQTWP